MRIFLRILIFLFFVSFFGELSAAKELTLNEGQDTIALGKYIRFVEDKTKSITINDIISRKLDISFQQGNGDTIVIKGFVDADYWFEFPTIQTRSRDSKWYITIDGSATDTMKNLIFYFTVNGEIKAIKSIPDIKVHQIKQRFPTIVITIPKELSQKNNLKIFARIEAYGNNTFPFFLSSEKISLASYKEVIFVVIFLGPMFFLFLFNSFICIFLKDKAYFFYICYLFLWILVSFISFYKLEVIFGFHFGYKISLVFYALLIMAFVRFCYYFFDIKKNIPHANYLFSLLIAIGVIIIGSAYINIFFAYQATSLFGLLVGVSILGIAIMSLCRGQKQARFFLIGLSVYTLSIIVWAPYINGYIEHNFLLANIHILGSLIEATFLSFALVDRYYLLKQEIEMTYIRLKKANVQMIQAFGTTVEKRDPYTAGHQFRVSNLAEAIAKQMKLEKHFIESVKLSALIHDIGKIGVAKSLLTKKKRLSDDEFQKIKNHVSIGYDIVKNLDIEQEIKDGILHHHERLDGSGYPLGIKKEQISLIGKILAVADTVEAIANARPYRTALGLGEAIKVIKKGRNKTYDKQIIKACLKVLKSGFHLIRKKLCCLSCYTNSL